MRNLAIVIGGLIAGLLAVWRSRVAEKQANVAQEQASVASRQAATAAEQSATNLESFLNGRYEHGIQLLSNESASSRQGGIDVLKRLAREHPDRYHNQVTQRLCDFLRNPDGIILSKGEIRSAFNAIGLRSKDDMLRERTEGFEPDLSAVNFHGVSISQANLSGSNLIRANLTNTDLFNTNLSNSKFYGANVTDALFFDADLSGAAFSLGEGDYPVVGLTQTQLDSACAAPDNPPKLEGITDPQTRNPLTPPSKRPNVLQEMQALLDRIEEGNATT